MPVICDWPSYHSFSGVKPCQVILRDMLAPAAAIRDSQRSRVTRFAYRFAADAKHHVTFASLLLCFPCCSHHLQSSDRLLSDFSSHLVIPGLSSCEPLLIASKRFFLYASAFAFHLSPHLFTCSLSSDAQCIPVFVVLLLLVSSTSFPLLKCCFVASAPTSMTSLRGAFFVCFLCILFNTPCPDRCFNQLAGMRFQHGGRTCIVHLPFSLLPS